MVDLNDTAYFGEIICITVTFSNVAAMRSENN